MILLRRGVGRAFGREQERRGAGNWLTKTPSAEEQKEILAGSFGREKERRGAGNWLAKMALRRGGIWKDCLG